MSTASTDSTKELLKNSVVTLHFDNNNAAIIYGKGSPKFRLQKYAVEIDDLCLKWKFQLNTVQIPRSLNKFSDQISNCIDMDDYGVTQQFFEFCCEKFQFKCNFDRFANNLNAKTPNFNSLTSCVGSKGVDSFNYNWGQGFKNWLFPPPNRILATINHLKICGGQGLLVTPQWKAAAFYPFLSTEYRKFGQNFMCCSPRNALVQGIDKSSYFGPHFNCAINIWHFDYSDSDNVQA